MEPGQLKKRSRTGFFWLIAAALLTVILWRAPAGNYILYPFTILATWFHEMAHGLAAMMLGGSFEKLVIYPNGSGVAYYIGPTFLGSVGQAVVAAAGPLGPPIAGAALIMTSRKSENASIGLYILGIVLIVSTVLWVRSLFGLVAILAIGLAILALAIKASPHVQEFAGQFLGVQACVSTYLQIDYLFRYSAGPLGISDTGQIQHVLLLPYWLWGMLLAVASFFILILSLRFAYRS
jgi:hypothetical protein